MTVSRTDSQALDQCRQAVAAEAGHIGGAADTIPAACSAPTIFGRLPSAAAMASAVDAVGSWLRCDFEAAEQLLKDVEQAIGAVEASVRSADQESAHGLTTAVV